MIEAEVVGIREKVIRRINGFPASTLIALQNYVEYLAGEDWDINKEYDIPLDDFDYELAREADEDKDAEEFEFETVLKECGLTYADLQD